MCGFAGVIEPGSSVSQTLVGIAEDLERMSAQLHHRGPDDGGIWVDRSAGYGVCHRRLAVQDLSRAGHQPMRSHSGRYVMAFNGEIYNHLSIRDELEEERGKIDWHSHSDTETLLEAITAWGVSGTLKRVIGMFAFAVWDTQEQRLTLARDRMGEKPLYYGFQDGLFLFGSELKALRVHPRWQGRINRDVLSLYLRYNCVPSPHSIYEGIFKLPQGSYLELPVRASSFRDETLSAPTRYWSLARVVERGGRSPFCGSSDEAKERLALLLGDAVRQQLISDAPLGAFLSGGVDSSMVVALMQLRASSPVNTFAIGFEEADYDEAPFAAEVARHLGTRHETLYVSSRDAIDLIPELPKIWDEPFSDASQIPMVILSRFARQHVTVSLSGDGGDELFGGYNRHIVGERLWPLIHSLPESLRKALLKITARLPVGGIEAILKGLGSRTPQLGEKLDKVRRVLGCAEADLLYQQLVSAWLAPDELVIGAEELGTLASYPSSWPRLPSYTEKMIYLDTETYLPDDVLTKVDRSAMAASLETRAPMLDHRLVEFAWSLPLSMKIKAGKGKWLLRQLLHDYIPEALIDRPKQGFSVPIDHWLRGPVREWAESMLSRERLNSEGYFHAGKIHQAWHEFIEGRRPCHQRIWNILMFQAWLETQ